MAEVTLSRPRKIKEEEEEEENEENEEVGREQEIPVEAEESFQSVPVVTQLDKSQEDADREFAIKLSERLNNNGNSNNSTVPPPSIERDPTTTTQPESVVGSAPHDTTSDFELALRLSQELNPDVPLTATAAPRPVPTYPPPSLYPAFAAPPPSFLPVQPPMIPPPQHRPAPAPPAPLSQEEMDRRMALELDQALNVNETTDREIALRVSQQLNAPATPPRAVYVYQTPQGPSTIPYIQQRTAEEIKIEAEIARVTQALSNPQNDADSKMALELQLQELVAYQRQLHHRRLKNDDTEDGDDFLDDGIKMLDEGYEKFKGFSKEMVQTLDKYGSKVENVFKSLVGSKVEEKPSENGGEKEHHQKQEPQERISEEKETTIDDEEPLTNLRKRRPILEEDGPPLVTSSSSVVPPATSTSTSSSSSFGTSSAKAFSLRLVEKLDEVGHEIESTVVDLFFGGSNKQQQQQSQQQEPFPTSLSSSSSTVPTTSSSTTTTTTTAPPSSAQVALPDFRGGNAKDSDDSLFPL